MSTEYPSSDRWPEIKEILGNALDLPTESRPAYLAEACGTNRHLRGQLEALLRQEEAASPLDQPAFDVHHEDLWIGKHIGPFRVLKLLGRGGMGAVYLAERRGDVRQQVALKLIKRGMDTDELVRRFHQERQILAQLIHLNIARFLDSGTAEKKLPFFAMEYVEGQPIDRYCRDRRLSIRHRLRLFLEVCSGVQFAHRNLVVHRDLKPGNILVTEEGVPKLLDFGIAKVLAEEPSSVLELTAPDRPPMTLTYASPEQVRNGPITTASDIYSLGVVLFELLTGHRPFDLEGLSRSECEQLICERDPTPPSSTARSRPSDDSAEEVLRPKGQLARDLDAIVLQALRKEPDRRYGSVEGLAEDIERYLGGLPVRARKPTLAYRAYKLVRRQPVVSGLVALVIGLSLGFGSWNHLLRQQTERTMGQHIAIGDRYASIRKSFIKIASKDEFQPLLDEIKSEIDAKHDPQQKAWYMDLLAAIYSEQDKTEMAIHWRQRALTSWDEGGQQLSAGRATLLNNLARSLWDDKKYKKSEDYFRESIHIKKALEMDDIDLVRTKNNLGRILKNRGAYKEAKRLFREGLRTRQKEVKHDASAAHLVATSHLHLGSLYHVTGDLEKALDHLNEALQLRRSSPEVSPDKVAFVHNALGAVLTDLGDLRTAGTHLRKALDIYRKLGTEHKIAEVQTNLAALYLAQGRIEQSIHTIEEARRIFHRSPPRVDWWLHKAEGILGSGLLAKNMPVEALPYLMRSYHGLRRELGTGALLTRQAKKKVHLLFGNPEIGDYLLHDSWDSAGQKRKNRTRKAAPTVPPSQSPEDLGQDLELDPIIPLHGTHAEDP